MTFDFILYEKKQETAIITLNRPSLYNALNKKAKKEITKALSQAVKDGMKTAVLTGAGKAFCTGQDLTTLEKGSDLGRILLTEWNPLMLAIRHCPLPVIGALSGVCAGAGMSLALSCDLLVGGSNVKFISGFAKLGLAPDAGSNFSLVHGLGRQRTLAFFLLDNPLTGNDLLEGGILHALDENPLETALNLAADINPLSSDSVEMIKKNIHYAQEEGFTECLEREVVVQRFLGHTPAHHQGLNDFINKKRPSSGHSKELS